MDDFFSHYKNRIYSELCKNRLRVATFYVSFQLYVYLLYNQNHYQLSASKMFHFICNCQLIENNSALIQNFKHTKHDPLSQ
jgi:hypothetical protein